MIFLLKTILYIAQGMALWASFTRRKENKNSTQQYFLFFMVFAILIEIIANLIRIYSPWKNSFVYNIYIILSFYFFFYWFYTILSKKKISVLLIGLFTVGMIYSIATESFSKTMLSGTLYTGTGIILIFSVMYYSQLLHRIEVLNYLKLQPFWITTGLLIFYLGLLPLQYLLHQEFFDKTVYQFVIMVLNVIMYGCFTIAFLCPIKK